MALLGFLILFPLVVAIVLYFVAAEKARDVIVWAAGIIIAVASIVLIAMYLPAGPTTFALSSHVIDIIGTIISVIIAIVILKFAVTYRNLLAGILAVIQVVGSLIFELVFAPGVEVPNGLYIDNLSLIMTGIIGIIGSGICIYALGYMKDFQAHEPEGAKDRRPFFFAMMFLFLSAMYVIVFSDNMSWLFCGWEVTTLCSFLLIGFTKTEEAIRNAFRQIIMNILGGIGFLVALYFNTIVLGTLSLSEFIAIGVYYSSYGVAMLPLIALAFAGITKAAQMPFQTWLLGAMVAPTPTSALLHSSTMVKAGVFLLVKLAPLFLVYQVPGYMVMLVGAITFLLCSLMAISQTNAKRVLAYSTIANLGLITACAGVGTPESVWAAVFLIVFHAIAKSLLFLCVGTAEHHIGSRDIEDMDLLFDRMPRLARFMMLGIMCMFVAPFGMLIAKWATLVSFADMNQVVLIIILGFGSAATFMFWAKWLGKLSGIAAAQERIDITVHKSEWAPMVVMAVLIVLCCALLPIISDNTVEPYINGTYNGIFGSLGGLFTTFDNERLSADNLWIASVAAIIVFVIIFASLGGYGKSRKVPVYLAGISADNENRVFVNSLSQTTQATARNLYLDAIFGEKRISPIGTLVCAAIIVCIFLAGIYSTVGLFF